eukprot:scaffold18435_cov113-Isochrysis_galbana.AAC.9
MEILHSSSNQTHAYPELARGHTAEHGNGAPTARLGIADVRFHKQFKSGQLTKFKSYSKYPPCYKDIAFWLPESGFEPNDFFELGRGVAGVGRARALIRQPHI